MAAVPMTSLGGRALSHGDDDEVEREYDRLRDAARAEAQKRNDCYERSRRAFEDGDGAMAKELSNQGKAHHAKMSEYNRQASEYIFRENNAPGRVDADCIDLHGQFVEEAERIVEQRIVADREAGRGHLHVIVGKGNHSVNHVNKIRPRVEELCRRMGLSYRTEENAGRILIDLGGAPAGAPAGGHYQPPPPQQQQQQQENEVEEALDELLPAILRKIQKVCCVVM